MAFAWIGFAGSAQDLSGREFWFTMPQNSGGASATNTYLLSLVSDYCSTVTVEIPHLGWSETVTLIPGLPTDVTLPNRTSGQTIYHERKNIVEGKGIHITADFPLVVYAVMYTSASTDAETILPMRMMGTDYVASFMTVMRDGSNNFGYMTVVATEDNTDVQIETWDGTTPITVNQTLMKGETYMIEQNKSNCKGDLNTTYRCWSFSGSVIKATKPVGVVCSTPCSDFPQCGACDGMMAMYTPIEEWGTSFVTSQVTKRKPVQTCGNYDGIADILEITGPIGTNVTIKNQDGITNLLIDKTINNGAPDYGYGTIIWNNPPFGGLTDPETSGESNTVITTDQPVEVMQYSKAYGFDDTPDTDPECIVVYPDNMWSSEYLIGNPPTLTGTTFKAVIMVKNGLVPDAKTDILLDGVAVGNLDWQDFAGGDYSFRRLVFSGATTHTIESPAGHEFGVYISLVAAAESYTTMGGMGDLIDVQCPDCPVVDFSFTEPCVGNVSNFTDQTVPGTGLNVVQWDWDFGDGNSQSITSAPGDVSHTYTTPGTYYVTLSVTDNGTPDPCTISITKKVRVLESPTAAAGADKGICEGDSVIIGGNPTGAGGEAPLTYTWSGGAHTPAGDPNPLAHNPTTTQYKVLVTGFNGCTAEDSMLLTVTPSIDLSIVNGSEVCEGESPTVEVNYSGTDPVDLVLRSDNSEEENVTGFTGGSITLSTTQSGRWFIKSATRNPAAGESECINISTDTVDVKIKTPASADLFSDMTICEGTDSTIIAHITGEGAPYRLFLSDDQGSSYTENTPADSLIFAIQGFSVTTQITLDSIGYGTGELCASPASESVTITVNPMPDAGNDVEVQLCNTLDAYDLVNDLDGASATSGTWIDVDGSGGLSGSILDTRNIPQGSYTFRYRLAGLAPCPADEADITVTINTVPTLTDIVEVCTPDETGYRVTAQVVGGTNPVVSTGNGTIDANGVLTSDVFITATGYTITVTDQFNCGEATITGFKKCDCLTSAGTMQTEEPLRICEGDSVLATSYFNNDFSDDGDDVLNFVLHDNSGKSLGNVIDQQATAEFEYPAGIVLGATYYVSSIAGNNTGNNTPDIDEDCFDVAAGLPVIFVQRPTLTLGNDTTICNGSSASVPVHFTGAQPFTIIHANDTVGGLSSDDFLPFFPTVDTTIIFTEIYNDLCNNEINEVYNIEVNNAPSVFMHGGNIYCENDGTASNNIKIDVDGDGTIFSISYDVFNDGNLVDSNTIGNISAGDDQTFNVGQLNKGSNEIIPTNITDNSGGTCPGIVDGLAEVIINLIPGVEYAISSPVICLGDSLEFVFTLAPITDSYSITIEDDQGNTYTFDNVRNLESRFIKPAIAGPFTYSITSINSEQTGCLGNINTGATDCQVNPAPTADLLGAKQYCFGTDSVELEVKFNGFPPFDFNFRSNGFDVFPNPISVSNDTTFVFFPPAGSHTYEVFHLADQSAGQCPGVGLNTATFDVSPIPFVTVPQNFDVCIGDSVVLDFQATGNGPITLDMGTSEGHSFQMLLDPDNDVPNDYVLYDLTDTTKIFIDQISDASSPNMCTSTTEDSLTVFVNALPTIVTDLHPDNPEACFGDRVKFQFSLEGSERASVAYTHIESGDSDEKTILATSSPRDILFDDFIVGMNHIRIDSIVNSFGAKCVAYPGTLDSVLVNPIPEANLNLEIDELCEGELTNLVVDATGRFPITVTVTDGATPTDHIIVDDASPVQIGVSPSDSTQYRINQIVDGSNPQCSNDERDGDDQVFLNVNPLPTAMVNDTSLSICEGDAISFPLYLTGNGNKVVVIETNLGGIDTVKTAGNLYTYSVSPTEIGTVEYTIQQITDSKGCTNVGTGTVSVEVKTSPIVDFEGVDIAGCPPIQPVFTNTSVGNFVDCTWNFGDGEEAQGSCSGIAHAYNKPGTYTVSLTLTTAEGCEASARKDAFVEVYNQPIASFNTAGPQTIRNSVVDFVNTSNGGDYFQWDFDGEGQSQDKDPTFEFPSTDAGVYMVTLVATNIEGCVDTITRSVSIEGLLNVNIPNSFTPDGDNKNDIFIPVLLGYDEENPEYEMAIFDRWGIPVFTTNNIDEGWDGNDMDGKPKKIGSYIYLVKIRSKYSAEKLEFNGSINLIR